MPLTCRAWGQSGAWSPGPRVMSLAQRPLSPVLGHSPRGLAASPALVQILAGSPSESRGRPSTTGPSFAKAGKTLPRTHTLQRSSVTPSVDGDRRRLETRFQWGLPSPDPLIWASEPLGEKEEWAAHGLTPPRGRGGGRWEPARAGLSVDNPPWPCNVGTETGVLASLPTLLFTCCVTSDHSLNLSGLSFPHL